jgi:hypothetical protein
MNPPLEGKTELGFDGSHLIPWILWKSSISPAFYAVFPVVAPEKVHKKPLSSDPAIPNRPFKQVGAGLAPLAPASIPAAQHPMT